MHVKFSNCWKLKRWSHNTNIHQKIEIS